MDTIYTYAFNKAIDDNDDVMIHLCLDTQINYKITNKQLKKYVKSLLINHNMISKYHHFCCWL